MNIHQTFEYSKHIHKIFHDYLNIYQIFNHEYSYEYSLIIHMFIQELFNDYPEILIF